MPRTKRKRIVCREPDYICFRADGIPPAEAVVLTVDEFETIRLVDLEKQTHEETARQMQVSRTTVTEIYESARFKLADSIVSARGRSPRAAQRKRQDAGKRRCPVATAGVVAKHLTERRHCRGKDGIT